MAPPRTTAIEALGAPVPASTAAAALSIRACSAGVSCWAATEVASARKMDRWAVSRAAARQCLTRSSSEGVEVPVQLLKQISDRPCAPIDDLVVLHQLPTRGGRPCQPHALFRPQSRRADVHGPPTRRGGTFQCDEEFRPDAPPAAVLYPHGRVGPLNDGRDCSVRVPCPCPFLPGQGPTRTHHDLAGGPDIPEPRVVSKGLLVRLPPVEGLAQAGRYHDVRD